MKKFLALSLLLASFSCGKIEEKAAEGPGQKTLAEMAGSSTPARQIRVELGTNGVRLQLRRPL